MMKNSSHNRLRYRSLLQKAVRRGHVDLAATTSDLIENEEGQNWYTTRTAIITFEECWPLGAELIFNKKFHSRVAALIKVAGTAKCRDAAGLGYLAHALFEGDTSVLDGSPEDRDLKLVAGSIKRPDDFWQWIAEQEKSDRQAALIRNARRFKNEGLARDRAVARAAAHLVLSSPCPPITAVAPPEQVFPFWIAFDRHTIEGKLALRDVARDLHIPLPQLEWSCFYFEGAKTNAQIDSQWWERYCRWLFKKVGLPAEEAHLLWEPARPQVVEALARESRQLQNELYRWKIANRQRIESLKQQAQMFIAHFGDIRRSQLKLF
jgi:hypothetical protein